MYGPNIDAKMDGFESVSQYTTGVDSVADADAVGAAVAPSTIDALGDADAALGVGAALAVAVAEPLAEPQAGMTAPGGTVMMIGKLLGTFVTQSVCVRQKKEPYSVACA